MSTLISGMKAEPVVTLSRFWATVSTRTGVLIAIIMALALAYWLWYGLTQKSITTDDGISILAAQGILEHGYSRLPSGFIYYRGYLPNYLMAGSIAAFGLNDFAIMLPSLLMALGSLGLTYLFARDVLGRPLVGVASVALLLVLDVQTFYATSPRMYMSLQFFTILSAYSAWLGYIKGEGKFQWVAILAVAGAFLSQQQGGMLLVAIALAVIAIRWLQGKDRPRINYPLALTSYAVLWVVFIFPFLYPLPDGIQGIAAHGGAVPDHAGLNLNVVGWLKQIFNLERSLPFGLCLVPLLLALVYDSHRRQNVLSSRGTIYTFLIFTFCTLAIVLAIKSTDTRFWLMILPFYVLLLCNSIAMAINLFKEAPSPKHFFLAGKAALVLLACIAWTATILLVAYLAYSPNGHITLAKEAYGMPCVNQYITCSKVVKEQYNLVRPVMQEGDLIISSNPWVTSYYLGRVDAYIREKKVDGTFMPFDSPTDEYFGISFIDSPKKLVELQESSQRAWVFADFKVDLFAGEEVRDLLAERYVKYLEGSVMTVYLNR